MHTLFTYTPRSSIWKYFIMVWKPFSPELFRHTICCTWVIDSKSVKLQHEKVFVKDSLRKYRPFIPEERPSVSVAFNSGKVYYCYRTDSFSPECHALTKFYWHLTRQGGNIVKILMKYTSVQTRERTNRKQCQLCISISSLDCRDYQKHIFS